MPTYEYCCQSCGEDFEVFHAMSANPLTDCDRCGAEGTVKRRIGRGAGIIFKGSGFYETDFKDKPKKPAEGGEKSDKTEKGEKPKDAAATATATSDAKAGKKEAAGTAPSTSKASAE